MRELDYNKALPVTREIYWVGFYDQEADLHCNPYLLIDEKDVVLFDPGSIPHFPIVMRKILDLVNPKEISVIVASHQGCDVCGNLAVVEDVIDSTDLRIAAQSSTIRFLRQYGLKSKFYAVDKNDFKLILTKGRTLEFLPTPYLHTPGAVATYDRKTKSLFSGDLFGAISEEWSLFAGDGFLGPMEVFHQLYVPSKKILKNCLRKLERLDIARILPQHGSVLEGEQVHLAIEHLKKLPCGIDLMEK